MDRNMKKSLAALLLPALSSGCFIYDTEYDNVASAPPGAVYAQESCAPAAANGDGNARHHEL